MPMSTIDQVDDDELSMVDFFDAEELLNEEKIQVSQGAPHQPFERRASIEFAKQLWSSSSEESESAMMSEDEANEDEPIKTNPSSTIDASHHSQNSHNACCSSEGGFDCQQYNQLVAKLAESMKRSEQSRAQIIRHRRSYQQRASMSCSPSLCSENDSGASSSSLATSAPPSRSPSLPSSQHQVPSGLSSFLNGSQSTLTSGLEQSRRQLAAYMSQVSNRCHGMTSPMA
uniref:Uncharacterized protein n=2 Tax=Pseudictyota dubia TaxID=2749911 RepID=A0A7R9ZAA2_9STRA